MHGGWHGNRLGPCAMFTEEIDPIHVLRDPPDLTAGVAFARFREINLLLHSLSLLGNELRVGRSLLPILRSAASLVLADRALLYRWDEVSGTPGVTASLGFGADAAVGAPSVSASVQACMLHRKPVLVCSPSQEFLRRELRALEARASLSVPLAHEGLPWGAIQLLRDRAFGEDEAVLMWLFAQVLEGILPASLGSRRHCEMDSTAGVTAGLLTPEHFRRRLDWEIQLADRLAQTVGVTCVEVTEMLHGRPRSRSAPFAAREASHAVRRALGPDDSLTCLGGLHFVAVMPNTSPEQARRVAEVICQGLLACSAGTLPVFDIATGFAAYPEDGRSGSDLMRAACAGGRRDRIRLSRSPRAS